MGQMGFFDLGNRYSGLDAKNEPLLKIDGVVPWEDLRARLEAVWRRADKARKSRAGRKPWDAIVMFKTIILCALYNLSDDQVEHQIRDRLSFMRFLGLGLEGRVPDAKTVWLYREQLTQAGVIEALFETFDGYLKDQGYLAMGGQIIDASIVAVPKQRNSREENARIKAGETPAGWEDKPAKRRQKDVEARWTKKHGKSHYGYKNHVNVDRRHKLVRRYHVSDAAEHDSQVLDDILDGDNTALGCVGGQRLPLGGDRGGAEGEGVAEPDPSQGPPQQAAERAREARQQDPFVGSGPRRACLRGPEQRHGRDAGT